MYACRRVRRSAVPRVYVYGDLDTKNNIVAYETKSLRYIIIGTITNMSDGVIPRNVHLPK